MSNSYFLVCMECKTGLDLGKAVNTKYRNIGKETYGFSALGHTYENGWKGTESSFVDLQHFLMLHRTHELRVLPDTVNVHAAKLGFPNSFPCEDDFDPEYNRDVFLETNVGKPDAQAEAENLPIELIEKLKEF